MIRAALVAACLIAPLPVAAQSIVIETTPLTGESDSFSTQEPTPKAETGTGAVLRALDKVNGQTLDIELPVGQTAEAFGLEVGLADCRYPAGNPAGDAYAFLVIRDAPGGQAVFTGWMIASSPALSALDHARYDVWVLRCITS